MYRLNDGKPSVSRRKSSSPQKRVVDALTMVDKADSKNVVVTNYASTSVKQERLSSPTSANMINIEVLDNRTLEASKTNSPYNNPLPGTIQLHEESSSFPAIYGAHFYGRGPQQRQIDIQALYADSQIKKGGTAGELIKGLPLCPPPAPVCKKKQVEILPPIMHSGAKKFAEKREEHIFNRGKKMVDVRELYGSKQEYHKSVLPNGPPVIKKKTVKDLTPSTTPKTSAIENIPQAGRSCFAFTVAEMELHEVTKPGYLYVEPKYDPTVKCDPNLLLMKEAFQSTSTSISKKRVRKLDPAKGLSAPKKTAASSLAKKRADVETSYRARNVYESDCTSNAASDTGTLPQGNAKQKANICPYKECSQSFARPWRLAAHIRKHKGERPFRCEVEGCSRDYTNPSHLRRHILRNHSEAKEKIQCPSDGCFMTLASSATLKRHIERRHGPCNFECELCNQKFRKHGELRVHKLTHNPSLDLLYVCAVCNSGFNDKRLHKKHLRTHRTYPCLVPNCNQVFGTWTIFLKHTKNDHPASKYMCAVCSRAFTVKKNLEFHLETHKNSSERTKLTCQFRNCNKFYFQQRNLTAHVKRCHCNDTFDCPYPNCSSKLSTKQKLSHHLESVHGLARGSGMQYVKMCKKKSKSEWEGSENDLLAVKLEVPE